MTRRLVCIAAAAVLSSSGPSAGQQVPRTGPVIESAGATFDVPAPGFATPLALTYKVVFDVGETAQTAGAVNPGFETAARFLNMHARAGVPRSQLQLAMVVHGGASFDLLRDDARRERAQADNPNLTLLRELADAGVRMVLCGQSAASRSIRPDELVEGADVALSAMTALYVLQAEGYRVNPF